MNLLIFIFFFSFKISIISFLINNIFIYSIAYFLYNSKWFNFFDRVTN